MTPEKEIWLKGPVPGVPALLQPVAHALLQARAECRHALDGFPGKLLWARPAGLAAIGFHLRHIAGVTDRMLTYAAGQKLSEEQFARLRRETEPDAEPAAALLDELDAAVDRAIETFRRTDPATLADPRKVGRKELPSSVAGLLYHAGEHGMRHVGQLIATVRVLRAGHTPPS